MPSHYFVLDTSALVFKYLQPSDISGSFIKTQMDELFAARARSSKSMVFQLPNICMAECSKVFGWACFEANLYGIQKKECLDAYGQLRRALLADVKEDRIINSYEFRSEHLVDIEDIFSADYLSLPKPDPKKKGRRLSSHDALILAITKGIAENHAAGLEHTTLVTAENRMALMCQRLPDRFPAAVNVRQTPIKPRLESLGFA